MKMNYPLVIVSVFVASIVLLALTPNFIGATYGTEILQNEGAGWCRFNYSTGTTANVEYKISDGNISIGGTYPQNGPADDMIIWADNNLSVYLLNGSAYYVGNDNGTVKTGSLSNNFEITKLHNKVRIRDNGVNTDFPVSSWAYIPSAYGPCAFFSNGTGIYLNSDYPVVSVGSYAGVSAYNQNTTRPDLSLGQRSDYEDGKLTGIDWAYNQNVSLQAIEDNIGNIHTLSALPPTPQHVSGDWGYNIIAGDGPTAKIVSYSGPAGTVTVPATLDGYTIVGVGLGSSGSPVIDNSIGNVDLIISPGIENINAYAFTGCNNILSVTWPSSVHTISDYAFNGCSNLATISSLEHIEYLGASSFNYTKITSIEIPASVGQIRDSTFKQCWYLADVTIDEGITSIGSQAFTSCLSLSSIEIPSSVHTIDDLAFMSCTSLEDVTLTRGLKTIGQQAFKECFSTAGSYDLIIPDTVTSIGSNAYQDTNIKHVLNLSGVNVGVNDYGLNADDVKGSVPALGYISAVDYPHTYSKIGPAYVMIRLIPLAVLIGLFMFIFYKIRDKDNYD